MPSIRTVLDQLTDEARKDKYGYAEFTLTNGAKLTVGHQYVYHLRFSATTGQQDVGGLSVVEAYDVLSQSANGPEALEAFINGLREAHPLPAPPKARRRQMPRSELDGYAPGDGSNRKH